MLNQNSVFKQLFYFLKKKMEKSLREQWKYYKINFNLVLLNQNLNILAYISKIYIADPFFNFIFI